MIKITIIIFIISHFSIISNANDVIDNCLSKTFRKISASNNIINTQLIREILRRATITFDHTHPFYHNFRKPGYFTTWKEHIFNSKGSIEDAYRNWITTGDFPGLYSYRGNQKILSNSFGKDQARIYLKKDAVFINASDQEQILQLQKLYQIYKNQISPTHSIQWIDDVKKNSLFINKLKQHDDGARAAEKSIYPNKPEMLDISYIITDLGFLSI